MSKADTKEKERTEDKFLAKFDGDNLKKLDALRGKIASILKLGELPSRIFALTAVFQVGCHVLEEASQGRDRLMTYEYVKNGDVFIRVEEWLHDLRMKTR
ncbi:MAG: hypothetical protein HYT37_00465 [Candidatus Sungbacteria bacterium]|nr:hypothetical protein [Candidatus Sungbacteria bacterium]